MLFSLLVVALVASAQGRVVNISNTWVLPEEGFPVFYRYFRDRISWYEADAVCQFHHANLVTVDTTAQYDAVRAYLKELDITSAVWIGLIRSNPDGDFTWTDYRGLSGDGYWSSAPDTRSAPICAAADPTADYRWEARACGGPMVAAFICELPVPQWASGSEGCMVRELPALTVLYLPESAAVQLTADCGLAGVKRVQCTGNVKREDLLRDLSCVEEAEERNVTSEISTETITTELNVEQETSQNVNDENNTSERETTTVESNLIRITPIPYQLRPIIREDTYNKIPGESDININIISDQNLESNDIPKYADENNFLTEEESNKLEEEKHMAHKQLHNDLARLGNINNFETIFNQPSDHFVPPLVMAKAKMSDDMTVLSIEEKHAQQLAEQHKHKGYGDLNYRPVISPKQEMITSTEVITSGKTPPDYELIKNKDIVSKDIKMTKYSPSKKYNEKLYDSKSKNTKTVDKTFKYTDKNIALQPTEFTMKELEKTTTKYLNENNKSVTVEDHTIDLKIILIEPHTDDHYLKISPNSTKSLIEPVYRDNKTKKDNIPSVSSPETQTEHDMAHEVIKITIPNNQHDSDPTILEVTTLIPITEKNTYVKNIEQTTTQFSGITKDQIISDPITPGIVTPKSVQDSLTTTKIETTSIKVEDAITTGVVTPKSVQESLTTTKIETTPVKLENIQSTKVALTSAVNVANSTEEISNTSDSYSTTKVSSTSTTSVITEIVEKSNTTLPTPHVVSTSQMVPETTKQSINLTERHDNEHDDFGLMEEIPEHGDIQFPETEEGFQSPLLSAANEPVHRPNRSRRPQQIPTRIKKFNPFRILG